MIEISSRLYEFALNRHGSVGERFHHSRNSHLVTQGSIEIAETTDNRGNRYALPLIWTTYRRNQWAYVDAGVRYMIRAGRAGGTFVEGHEALSPDTAQRMLRRQHVRRANPNDENAFWMQFRRSARRNR